MVFFRNRGSIAVEDVNLMKGNGTMYAAIVFLPLVGALLAGFFGKLIGDRGSSLSYLYFYGCFYVARCNMLLRCGSATKCSDYSTIYLDRVGNLKAEWALKIDTLTAIMILVVTSVSTMVHVYSIGYMHHDPHNPAFSRIYHFYVRNANVGDG